MKDLRVFLDYYIAKTLQTHPALHNLNVVVSDSDGPGEGEHKIMEFIRSQRTQPDYSPSQSHIIHGLDADLSMLALSSHEPNFFILVEQLFSARCAICGATDHRCLSSSPLTQHASVRAASPQEVRCKQKG